MRTDYPGAAPSEVETLISQPAEEALGVVKGLRKLKSVSRTGQSAVSYTHLTMDARKALKMFEKVDIPVLGLVENMAAHVCSQCGHSEHIFGEGGAQWMSQQYGVPVLGSLPLQIAIREQGDAGKPIVVAQPDSAAAQAYRMTARALLARLAQRPKVRTGIAAALMGAG